MQSFDWYLMDLSDKKRPLMYKSYGLYETKGLKKSTGKD